MPRYATLAMCRNRAGFESAPEGSVRVDLGDLERRAPAHGLEPLVNAGVILVLRVGRTELSVFEHGKMLFKTRSAEEALAAMRAVFGLLGWEWVEPQVADAPA